MRHRITSFRAVEPGRPSRGWAGSPAGVSRACDQTYLYAAQQQDLRVFFFPSSSPLRPAKGACLACGSALAAILHNPGQFRPAWQVKRRISGRFQHEPAAAEGDRVKQRIVCGQARGQAAGRRGAARQGTAGARGRDDEQRAGSGRPRSPQVCRAGDGVAGEDGEARPGGQAVTRGGPPGLIGPGPGAGAGRRVAPVGGSRRGWRRGCRAAGHGRARRGRRSGRGGNASGREQQDDKRGDAICLHPFGME